MERGGGFFFFLPAGDFFLLTPRSVRGRARGGCQESRASSPGTAAPLRPASESELETPELTPEVE